MCVTNLNVNNRPLQDFENMPMICPIEQMKKDEEKEPSNSEQSSLKDV